MRLREQTGGRIVFLDLSSGRPEEVLKEISSRLTPVCAGHSGADVDRQLLSWYTAGSPGVARGVAIPHARCAGLSGSALCIARSGAGIDFGGGHDRPVRLVAALLSPAGDHSRHLAVLARVVRILRKDAVVEKLLCAPGTEGMARVLEEEDEAAANNDIPDPQQG
jgi:mannitol/fructose-specific phosphotransferase system IIA component (Ntr-type)